MIASTEYVWEAFSHPLQQFIRRRVADQYSADDILQDVFLKIHSRLATLQDQERLAAWIFQIARNAIADYYRGQRATSDIPTTLAAPSDVADDDLIQELAPCVAAMIEQLPEIYREALWLTEYLGLSQKELSERLGISFSGAKSRVQRARAQLKEQFLACCHFQLDHAGRIVDYWPYCGCETGQLQIADCRL